MVLLVDTCGGTSWWPQNTPRVREFKLLPSNRVTLSNWQLLRGSTSRSTKFIVSCKSRVVVSHKVPIARTLLSLILSSQQRISPQQQADSLRCSHCINGFEFSACLYISTTGADFAYAGMPRSTLLFE